MLWKLPLFVISFPGKKFTPMPSSSFKRKGAVKQTTTLSGTRISPASSSTCVTSTGIPSLDDILGGGLPLSCLLLITAPDLHSSYGDLVQKYFAAQGLSCGHHVYVVANDAEQFVKDIMWIPRKNDTLSTSTASEGVGELDGSESQIKIAWRYEQMKQFQTTVPSSHVSFIAWRQNHVHDLHFVCPFPSPHFNLLNHLQVERGILPRFRSDKSNSRLCYQ